MATNRPAPKRSSFGATHPIEHLEDKPAAVPRAPEGSNGRDPGAVAAETPSPSAAAVQTTEVPESRRRPGPAPSGIVKRKAAVWADEEVIERIRGAWFHTPTTSGERELSFSEFLLKAALHRTTEREQKYNKGKEFPHAPAGSIGVGRKG